MQEMDTEFVRMPGSNLFQASKTISLSGTGNQSDVIPLPAARLAWILIAVDYTVTDASISSGETLWGAVDRVEIGESGNRVVTFENDEAPALAAFLGGVPTGLYLDPLPTTATAAHAMVQLNGPFQLGGMETPELFIELTPITEWATASAFTGTVTVTFLLADDPDDAGYFVQRESYSADTYHEINPGPGLVEDALLIGTTTSYASKISLDRGEGKIAEVYDHPTNLNDAWLAATRQSSDAGKFLLENIDMARMPNRRIIVENGTADTMTAFIKNLVSA